ncbi:MAG TPA: AmmeMemoRadiSam system protein B [Verrucomicrobiae bacterium]|nr:AmmeMemoRadiSam system protein B [Verrucomicrobiae bacterium]
MSGKRRLLATAGVAAVAALMIFAVVCEGQQSSEKQSPAPSVAKRVREPAVAGLFYPKDPAALSHMLDALLANAAPHTVDGELRALICPHAGYPYSGPVAATAYRLLSGYQLSSGHDFQTVVLLAVSHYAAFTGASVANADIYRTPLGDVPISPKARELAKSIPFVLEPRCLVQRPPWASQASHSMPPAGEDTPETWEHSGEVQVPFLQKTLKNFTLVPVVTGEADPEQMARALAPLVDDKTLVLASSDLSHYHPYDEARARDKVTTDAIVNLDIDRMKLSGDACGKTPVLALMYLAKQKGWKATLLDYRNSGDTAGNKGAVVGYAAIAFYTPRQPEGFTMIERKLLLNLARRTLREAVTSGKLSEVGVGAFPVKLSEKKGCFVTLTEGGQLRGCIGHILPREPLYAAIMDNAQSAALRDHRFTPVQPDELDKIEIEISVLTVPEPLAFSSSDDLLNKLRPQLDGVVLQIGGRVATYLPQVWEQIPDKVRFMDSLAQKAGCAPDAWRGPETRVFIYHVEAFKESEL